jgi:YVTN family beta-propeller protein
VPIISRGTRRLATAAMLAVAAITVPGLASATTSLPTYNVTQPVGVSNVSAVAVDPATHRVYVTSGPSQSVIVLDGLTQSVLATIAVPYRPRSVAIDSATHRLFILGAVALVVNNPFKVTISLSIVDTTTNAIITTVPVPNEQGGLAVDPINHHVLALPSSFDETGKSLPNPPPIGRADAVAIDPAIQRLYVMNLGAGTITVYNSTTYKWIANVKVSASPVALAVDPATHSVYVSDLRNAVVSVISGTTDVVTATIPVGGTPTAIAIDSTARLVYVSNVPNVLVGSGSLPPGTVTVIDATHNTVLPSVSITGQAGSAIAVDLVTHTVWVGSGALTELDPVVSRRSGIDRFGTATAISGAAYDPQGADAVVLARSDTYPDALVGAPFAASKNAPLLYTSGLSLPAATSAEITRVLAPGKTVYLLGGTSAIPTSVATQLTGMGYVVTRLSGADRYATAVAVADAMGDPSVVFLATAGNYADALAAGPAAAVAKGAILLTAGNTLPAETSAYLQAHSGSDYAIGGPAAAADPSASAISGADRYATAALVAQQFFAAPTTVGLASGTTFADALPAAAYLARVGGPLLLTDPNTLPAPAQTYLVAVQSTVTSALVFGGTSAVSTTAQSEFSTALGR